MMKCYICTRKRRCAPHRIVRLHNVYSYIRAFEIYVFNQIIFPFNFIQMAKLQTKDGQISILHTEADKMGNSWMKPSFL